MRQSQKRSEWEQRIRDCEASGQTIATWCAANDIKLCNFHYWKRRLRDLSEAGPDQPVRWFSLDIRPSVEPAPAPEGAISVAIGQARIILAAGFDQHLFRDIVNILKSCD